MRELESQPNYYTRFLGYGEDGTQLWEVDGDEVRKQEIEFTNVATDKRFPDLIPDGQIWFDVNLTEDEIYYFTYHQVRERKFMGEGMPWEKAAEAANVLELEERHQRDNTPLVQNQTPERAANFQTRLLGTCFDPRCTLEIWEVDGPSMRAYVDVDYTEGSNYPARRYNPENKIFIDSQLPEGEVPYVIFHELLERSIMRAGVGYERAHKITSETELALRLRPERLPGKLKQLGYAAV